MEESEPIEIPERVIKLDFQRMRRIADIALTRSSLFIAFSANATIANPPIGFDLQDPIQYRFGNPEKLDQIAQRQARDEFNKWVIGNALRDLVDAYSLYLANCIPACHIMSTGQFDDEHIQQLFQKAEGWNLLRQYNEISKYLDLDPQFADMFSTLLTARNCLSHNFGVVRTKDINSEDNKFSLRWVYLAPFIAKPDGPAIEVSVSNIGTDATYVEKGGVVQIKRALHERIFVVGESLSLSRHELGEICMGFNIAIEHVNTKLFESARAKGITETSENPETTMATPVSPPSFS